MLPVELKGWTDLADKFYNEIKANYGHAKNTYMDTHETW